MQRPDGPDGNDTFLADLEKDGFSHVALKKLDKKSVIKRLLHNQIVRGERFLGQSTALLAAVSAFAQEGTTPPTGFVVQVLEPTGGTILRPKDCFYTESHRGPSYVWTLSREDASKGPYTTGVRIQVLYFR